MSGPLVVLGDALLDIDLVGRASRVTPDAPALVVDSVVESPRPGGAGLAARIAARRRGPVVLVAPIAGDESAKRLRRTLDGIQLVELPWDGETPVKRRVRAAGQTLLRLDTGDRPGAVGPLPDEVDALLADASAVLVSDYGRGTTASPQVRTALGRLPKATPLVWDPHPRGAPPLPGVLLVTPNQREAAALAAAAGFDGAADGALGVVHAQAGHLVRHWRAQAVAVTMGERGALLSYGDGAPQVVPAASCSATDTCGAGDCFAVTAALCLADGGLVSEAVSEGVEAAGRYVREGGASGFTEPSRSSRAGVVVATGGCFDLLHAGHIATLEAARSLGDHLVVLLNSDDSVRRIKGPGRPVVGERDRARVLEALECVDEVLLFDEDTPVEAIRSLRPDVWTKGGDYSGTDLPEADVLAEWGGQTVVLPYLQGRSTTRLVSAAATQAQGANR